MAEPGGERMADVNTTNPYQFEARQSDDDMKTDLELTCVECGAVLCDVEADDSLGTLLGVAADHTCQTSTCKHCWRRIVHDKEDGWIDPEATGDDRIWRETCDANDTFTAEHEPED